MGNLSIISYGLTARKADSIVDGYFVEPHQRTMPFSEMLDWLVSRTTENRKGPVRYIQSQNGNLLEEFKPLQKDICDIDWATECFGKLLIRLSDSF